MENKILCGVVACDVRRVNAEFDPSYETSTVISTPHVTRRTPRVYS
jgi:hypothetical protein